MVKLKSLCLKTEAFFILGKQESGDRSKMRKIGYWGLGIKIEI